VNTKSKSAAYQAEIAKQSSTDEWFSINLKETQTLLEGFPALNSGSGLRPRIAILDTGLNTEHPEVKKLKVKPGKEQRLRGFWAPPSTRWRADQDEDGHGTHCAMVAHKVAPNADIYIARVFFDRKHVEGDYVVEASPICILEVHC
jgi:Subtilase family